MRKASSIRFSSSTLLLLSSIVLAEFASAQFCTEQDNPLLMATTLGGVHDSEGTSNSADIDELARFAVDEHNKKENALLEFVRVVKAQEQVVAGTVHHLTLEVVDAGKKKLYEVKVWVKSWMNFKELQEFKHAGDVPSITQSDLGAKKEQDNPQLMASTLGGMHDYEGASNSVDVDELARFSVDEHNKKENALLEFVRVVKAQEQVVAGTVHHLTLEVVDAGKKKLYEAKVWVKSWMNFKELQEFKHAGDAPSITQSDLGAKKGDHPQGWREVPPHDPQVQDAVQHAVRTIQQRSNSLLPYELLEIIHAKAEVIEEAAKFDLLLKLKRGSKEEKFKVEVHKNNEGNFLLNQMVQDQS